MNVVTVGNTLIDVSAVAAQVSDGLAIKGLPDFMQKIWSKWVVKRVLRSIGPELLAFMISAIDGVTPEEIDAHVAKFVKIINDGVNVPFLDEQQEAELIEPIVRKLLSYAAPGKALTLAGA